MAALLLTRDAKYRYDVAKCYLLVFLLTLARTKLYGCVVQRHHYLERIDGGIYNQEEYEQNPNLYKSNFNKKVNIRHHDVICFLFVKTKEHLYDR